MNTRNIRTPLRSFVLLTLLLAAARVEAQFVIDWFTLDGGGGLSSGGAYTLQGTTGQPDTAESSGGAYTLHGGFWSAFGPAESGPVLRIQREGANILLAWPNPSSGFQLQETPSLTSPNWMDVNTVPALVGGEKQISQPLLPGTKFYRLRKP